MNLAIALPLAAGALLAMFYVIYAGWVHFVFLSVVS
jgi:hypothetical protein